MRILIAALPIFLTSLGWSQDVYVLRREFSGLISFSHKMMLKGDVIYLDAQSFRGEHTCRFATLSMKERSNFDRFIAKEVLSRKFSQPIDSSGAIRVCEGGTEVLVGRDGIVEDYSIPCRELMTGEDSLLVSHLYSIGETMSRYLKTGKPCRDGYYLNMQVYTESSGPSDCAAQKRKTTTSSDHLPKDFIEKLEDGFSSPEFPTYLGNKNTDISRAYGIVLDYKNACIESVVRKVQGGKYVQF